MELLQYTFFQHALIGSLLASIVCGLIGTYIVTRRLVFISGGLTHASFGGIGLGLYAGISPLLSAAIFAVLSAFGVEWLSKRKDMREDSAIAVLWTFGMAAGIIFVFLSAGFAPDLSAYLFGNILTIGTSDLTLLAILAVVLILFFALYLRPIIYIAFDREFARSQGIPVQWLEYIMMMFIALTIVACLRMVGIVLVISLLTIPQMTANLFTHRFHRIIWLSIGIGYLSCLGGLTISYRLNVPSGATIIFFSILIYGLCKLMVSLRHRYAATLSCLLLLLLPATGCSTRRNTAGTRFYHALTTRYNVYFNGNEAYKTGYLTQTEGNRDNYLELLPLYPIGNEATRSIGTADYERAVEKAQKAIRLHSIKRRPARRPGRAYTAEYKQWLARREFNPFLYRAWMLLGKAQYQQGHFVEAASTFKYIARLYEGQPRVSAEAQIRLARCYTEMGWQYEAEEVLQQVNNDTLPASLADEYASSMADMLLHAERYRDAPAYLLKTARHEKNKLQRARCYYLLGQTYQRLNQPDNAYNAYRKVVSLTPPYELALSARIGQTEVMPASDTRRITSKLLHISRNENNKEYLDRIYYALGNVYLTARDTAKAIKAYRTGVEKSTRGGAEKGILQLKLGNLYWHQANYAQAQHAYTEAIGLMGRTHLQYGQATERSEILDELVPPLNTIALQDSLQRLAQMSDTERMDVIEHLIAHVIEQEEKVEQQQPVVVQPPQAIGTADRQAWYFYNPATVAQGKNDFIRRWGKRELEDNWRRSNKTNASLADFEETDYTEHKNDSLANTPPTPSPNDTLSSTVVADTATTDKHNPAYYLAQIPLTEEALQASNTQLSQALLSAGIIFKERMNNFARAKAHFNRLLTDFPDFPQTDEVYYQLFLTELAADYYNKKEHRNHNSTFPPEAAQAARKVLLTRFPDSKYARLLADPDYFENAIHGKHREDSLYADTYTRFQQNDTAAVKAAARFSAKHYPMGQHRPKFIFLDAMTELQAGNTRQFLAQLKELVQNYPENEITELATAILKGVQEGRLLAKDTHLFGSIWERRNADLQTPAPLSKDSVGSTMLPDSAFNDERNTPFLFVLAYEEGKVNENRLLFEVARYNFSTFVVKNFDLSLVHERDIGMLQVRSFANYDEAYQYFRRLYTNKGMATLLAGMRVLLISEANYEQLIDHYSFNEYDTFYRTHFSNIPEPEMKGYTLDEPLLNLPDKEKKQQPSVPEPDDGGVIFEN
ncbi:MAG: metal ABC transporter permease [Prevotellaceae bacterium]|jgi:ABC-type Mn2+/Zn2+ transport system permease subunit/tetratricopeptide (TPR) repeat protein|nr:metal ABC transporter permease [Prevotellaceae bacterium]